MNCKHCGKVLEQADWSETGWTHKATGLVRYRNAEPEDAVSLQSELDRLEPRYLETLDEQERTGQ